MTHFDGSVNLTLDISSTGWGNMKETLMATYKPTMRPDLEYASSICPDNIPTLAQRCTLQWPMDGIQRWTSVVLTVVAWSVKRCNTMMAKRSKS